MAQPPVQMVNMQPPPVAPNQYPIASPAQGQATQQQPQAPRNPLLRCIRFFACWECGPIGTIIAATAFATATVFTYQALKLAIWTATKDYIEHCQSVVDSSRATSKCIQAASQELRPPPFYRETISSNNTVYRRTLGGFLLGATKSRTHKDGYIWGYAVLLHAGSWLLLSKICQFSWKMALRLRHREINLADPRPIFEQVDVENISTTHKHPRRTALQGPSRDENIDSVRLAVSTGTIVKTGDNSKGLRLRHRIKKSVAIAPGLLEENPSCHMAKDFISISKALKAQGGRVGGRYPLPLDLGMFNRPATIQEFHKRVREIPERKVWLSRIMECSDIEDIRSLRNLYGLEISACTGNTRRVSVLHLMMSNSLRQYVNSFHWDDPVCRQQMEDLFERYDEEGFVTCYQEKKSWRENIHGFVRGALLILGQTTFDSSMGVLNALLAFDERKDYVSFPADWCPWADIMNDAQHPITMAIITDTCLSAKDIPSGRTCNHGMISIDQVPVLETRLMIRNSEANKWTYPHTHKDLSQNQNWLPNRRPRRLNRRLYLSDTVRSGVLENLMLVPGVRYCTAEWRNASGLDLIQKKRRTIDFEFREVLVRDEDLDGYITCIVPSREGEKGEKRE